MDKFVTLLIKEFNKHENTEIATGQKAYMKNDFDFFGVKYPIRKELQKRFFI